jgi:hypothetical protein
LSFVHWITTLDIDQIDAPVVQLAQLVEIIAAIDNPRVVERRGFCWHDGSYPVIAWRVNVSSAK